jgi:hypothetical protein
VKDFEIKKNSELAPLCGPASQQVSRTPKITPVVAEPGDARNSRYTNTDPARNLRASVTPVKWKLFPVLAGGIKRVQFFAGLEANRFAGGDADFGAGSRVAADACFPRPHTEHPKTAQLDALARGESFFQALKDCVYSSLRFGSGQPCAFDHVMDDVLLNQRGTSLRNLIVNFVLPE